jgi:hypothetical protein
MAPARMCDSWRSSRADNTQYRRIPGAYIADTFRSLAIESLGVLWFAQRSGGKRRTSSTAIVAMGRRPPVSLD